MKIQIRNLSMTLLASSLLAVAACASTQDDPTQPPADAAAPAEDASMTPTDAATPATDVPAAPMDANSAPAGTATP